jgi:hypothetical protein
MLLQSYNNTKKSIHSIQLQKEQFFQQKKTENKNSEEI